MARTAVERSPAAPAPAPGRPVTLRDVARAAGTSPSTASRALSGRGYVSADVRERLVAAAEQLGYVANASARTLKQQRSRTVGVVYPLVENPFYATLAAGIEQTLRAADHQMVLISDNGDSLQELAGARTFLAMRAAGVIVTAVSSEAAELLVSNGIPVVEVDRRLAHVPCDAVVIDNEQGARAATEHLLALGHRRIGLLVAKTDLTSDVGRLRGFREAHAAWKVRVDERLVVQIPPGAPDTDGRVAELIDERPTAIFAANNELTECAWRLLRRRRLRLPQDMSLVGFDDVPWMEMVDPGITVVAQPTADLGRWAASLLLRRAVDDGRPPHVECREPTLVVRGSTATVAG